MKKIQSKNHKKLAVDLQVSPPVNQEEEDTLIRDKKKKKIYQLNQWVDDISIEDVVE